MIHENFINRVIQALVEMRLDEGIVKRTNKAKKNKEISKIGYRRQRNYANMYKKDSPESNIYAGRKELKVKNFDAPTAQINTAGEYRKRGLSSDKVIAKAFIQGSKNHGKKPKLP